MNIIEAVEMVSFDDSVRIHWPMCEEHAGNKRVSVGDATGPTKSHWDGLVVTWRFTL